MTPWLMLALTDPNLIPLLAQRACRTIGNLQTRLKQLGAGLDPAPKVSAFRDYGKRTGKPAPVVWVGNRLWVNDRPVNTLQDLANVLREAYQVGVPYLADLVQNLFETLDLIQAQIQELEPTLSKRPEVLEAETYLEAILNAIRENQP
jgi:hypothetical protein